MAPAQAARTAAAYVRNRKNTNDVVSILCPSFSGLTAVQSVLKKEKGKDVLLGAQDCFWEISGAYTGEESPNSLVALGCKAVLIGHSERRVHLGESDDMIAKKVKAALTFTTSLIPVICIGETIQERMNTKTQAILCRQLRGAFALVKAMQRQCLIAYEPVWSISPGRPCTSSDCYQAVQWIRREITRIFPAKSRSFISIIYGGSVDSSNASDLITRGDIEGFLIGKASLDPRELARIHAIISKRI